MAPMAPAPVRGPPQQRHQPSHWQRPSPGVYKLNFDASFGTYGRDGLGMIARDSDGAVIVAATMSHVCVHSAVLAEAGALLWSLKLAIDLGLRRVVAETDCLSLF